MKQIARVVAVVILLAAGAGQALAQNKEGIKGDQFYPELQNDADMQDTATDKNITKSGVQYGAWITPTLMYQESSNNKMAASATTFRLWIKSYLWDNSYIYLRGKDTYTAYISQKGSSKRRDTNVADLDVGMIVISDKKKDVDFTIGRKYFVVGSGLVLGSRADGIELNYYSRYISFKALGAYTGLLLKDDNPYGLSDRDISSGARRVFAGGLVSTDFYNQTLYAFGIAQFDFGKEYYDKTRMAASAVMGFDLGYRYYGQKSRYASQYYGAGLQGVVVSGLRYSGEFIFETGKSYLSGTNVSTRIQAYAGIFKVQYGPKALLKPVVTAEYAFGSGDTNRDDYRSPTGNGYGRDHGFIYFGTYVGGYGLRPLLANLHIISGSVAFSPFSWSDKFFANNLTFIVKYLYYLKYAPDAYINSGLDATRPNRNVGQGVDVSMRWQIFTDLSFFANYGLFIPGKAYGYYYNVLLAASTYSSSVKRHFIMGGFNINF